MASDSEPEKYFLSGSLKNPPIFQKIQKGNVSIIFIQMVWCHLAYRTNRETIIHTNTVNLLVVIDL
jgi:hypothetical protein